MQTREELAVQLQREIIEKKQDYYFVYHECHPSNVTSIIQNGLRRLDHYKKLSSVAFEFSNNIDEFISFLERKGHHGFSAYIILAFNTKIFSNPLRIDTMFNHWEGIEALNPVFIYGFIDIDTYEFHKSSLFNANAQINYIPERKERKIIGPADRWNEEKKLIPSPPPKGSVVKDSDVW